MTRAVLYSTCVSAGPALRAAVLPWADSFAELVIAIDESADTRVSLPERWASVRALVADLPNVWVTPLVRGPGLTTPHDRMAALAARVGPCRLLATDDPALVPVAERLGLRVVLRSTTEDVAVLDTRASVIDPTPVRRALVVTRAQPFHRGHLALVEHALSAADEVVIVIAAAERAFAARDPFTAGERLHMVRTSLGPLASRAWLVALPAPVWPAMALAQLSFVTPTYELVFSHNPILRALAEEAQKRVLGLPACAGGDARFRVDGEPVRARDIRARLEREGAGAWLDTLVPAACAGYLRSTPALAERCALIAAADT